jgi:hypothetical protein
LVEQAKRMKKLERGNTKLRKAVSDLTIDKRIRSEIAKGKRDKLLNREIFYTFAELQVLLEDYRWHFIPVRPHSAFGDPPPAPEASCHAHPHTKNQLPRIC